MNKTWSIVLLIILVGGGMVFLVLLKNYSPDRERIDRQNTRGLQAKTSRIIKSGDDIRACNAIDDSRYRAICISNIAFRLAKEKKDISYCRKIDDAVMPRRQCEEEVVFSASLEKEDIALCKEAENQELRARCQNNFYYRMALKKNNAAFCDGAPDEKAKESCQNIYLMRREFIGEEKNFTCLSFHGQAAQNDCQVIQKNLATATIDGEVCNALETDVFSSYCSSIIE